MNPLRPQAVELRKQGKSYLEIEQELGVCRSNLWYWFSKEEWSQEIKARNSQLASRKSRENLALFAEKRKKALDSMYAWAKIEAERDYERFKGEPLFVAGLMLYSGEGDKRNSGRVGICNSDPAVLKIFKNFTLKYLVSDSDKLRASVLAYPDMDIEKTVDFWSTELNFPRTAFYKTQVIQGKGSERKLLYGVASIILSNKFLKVKLMEMIRLSSNDLSA